MAKYTAAGETIEGEKVHIQTRKWVSGALVIHPDLEKRMYRYKTDRNTRATVMKEGVIPENEEIRLRTAHYHRKEGDLIQCDAATVYVDCMRKITPRVLEGVTATHGANIVDTNNDTVVTVSMPLANMITLLNSTKDIIDAK